MPRRNTGPRVSFRKDRQCWEVIEYKKGVKQRLRTGFGSREEAQEALSTLLLVRPSAGLHHPSERMICDVLADYSIEHGEHLPDPQALSYLLEQLIPFCTGKTVDKITKTFCRNYENHRKKAFTAKLRAAAQKRGEDPKKIDPRAPTTVRKELEALRAALNHDVIEGRLTVAPTVWLPEKSDARERWLTRGEVARLLKAARSEPKARDHLAWFILLAYYSGQRKDAVLSLRWPQVDLERGRIQWNPPGRTQTKKRRPRQPIPGPALVALRILEKRGIKDGFVIHRNQERLKDIKRSFATAKKTAGLNDEDITPHTLRHTCVTHMLQNGASIWDTAKFVGMTADTIERTYGHHASEFLEDAKTRHKRR